MAKKRTGGHKLRSSSKTAKKRKPVASGEKIDRSILFLRGKRVMLAADLAIIFGTTTKRINESVKRNLDRFPLDFLFQLTYEERDWVVANCDHLGQLKFSPVNPYAFTEHGAIMVATILNTQVAIEASVSIVRAFVKLRQILSLNKDLVKRLNELEAKYDNHFKVVFEAIRKLMQQPEAKPPRIGYRRTDEKE